MKTRTKLGFGFGGQVLLAAVLGIFVLYGMDDVKRQFSFVAKHNAPVIANARHLSKLVVDMETGQRGFCIVQKEEFLAPYICGVKEFEVLIEEEKKLVSDNPGQVETLERIEHLVQEWQDKAAMPEIAMARKVSTSVIDAQVLQDILRRSVGRELIDRFMALGHEIEVSFSGRGDWEGAFAVEIIEKCMADREDGQRGFLITGKDEFLEKYTAGEQKKLPENFARLRAIVSERGRDDELSERINQLEQLTHEWTKEAAEPEIAARREMNEHPESLKDMAALLEADLGKALMDEIRREFDRFIEIEEGLAVESYDSAFETTVATRNIAITLLVLALCLGIAVAVMISRAVSNPLLKLVQSAERVGSGDLDTQVEVESSDEIGDLARTFNTMTVTLKEASLMRQQAEKDREDFETQLQRAQKMEAIGMLAGGVAHDLNNILGGLVSYPELLLLQLPEDSPLRKSILTIQKSGEKAAAVVQDLLTLARRGVVVTEVVNLNDVISEYLKSPEHENLQSYYPAVHIETHLEKDALNILGSSTHLSNTVMNLISNAAEAMPEGGKLTVSTENRYIDRAIRGYDNVKEGDYVVLTISDTGTGISPENIEKIFEPFYTKKKMGRSGTGLGMAVVWGTVKDHNGYIDVESTEEKGATFTLYFPVTRKSVEERSEISLKDYMGKGEAILIVDDVEEQRQIASGMLKELGYSVVSVSSGEEAVEHLKTNKVDLLVLDMIMDPGMDGLETYKKILELHPGQRAIIASGFSETDRVKEVQRLGAGAYTKKPFLLEKIGLAVKEELVD